MMQIVINNFGDTILNQMLATIVKFIEFHHQVFWLSLYALIPDNHHKQQRILQYWTYTINVSYDYSITKMLFMLGLQIHSAISLTARISYNGFHLANKVTHCNLFIIIFF